jgi:hypothetical protein
LKRGYGVGCGFEGLWPFLASGRILKSLKPKQVPLLLAFDDAGFFSNSSIKKKIAGADNFALECRVSLNSRELH